MKSAKTAKVKAFTLIEMLVVLLIISVLLLLFVPNLSKQKDSVKETGNSAVVKVVDSQAELYEMNHSKSANLSVLVSEGQITQKQADSYNDYYAKHAGESRSVAN
ncbi:competence type IV pilus major pilin ComGC [Streptococcus dentiloxodontae]